MTLWDAIKGKKLPPVPWSVMNLHVKTCDGKLGTVESVRRDENRGYLMVTLRHFNGEPFPHEYVSSVCEVLQRGES